MSLAGASGGNAVVRAAFKNVLASWLLIVFNVLIECSGVEILDGRSKERQPNQRHLP